MSIRETMATVARPSSLRSSVDITLSAQRETRYRVVECTGVFEPDGPLAAVLRASMAVSLIVVDETIWRTEETRIASFLDRVAGPHRVVVLPGGESSKNLDSVLRVVEAMEECRTPRRSSPVIAIGGGVVCDVVGYAASSYRRGVPYLRVPTTLLAQVDVSVAIKTGVNFGGHRNRLGAFWPAQLTIIDRRFLASQSAVQISHGLGEIVKLAVIKSAELFERLEELPAAWTPAWMAADDLSAQIGRLAVAGMAEDLEANLWEDDLARAVDFGHSFSPLIEMRNGQHHGHAVALDALLSSCIAVGRGLIDAESLRRIVSVMRVCGLPTAHPDYRDVDLLWESLDETIDHRDGHQHFPLPAGIGRCTFVEDLSPAELGPAVALMQRADRDAR